MFCSNCGAQNEDGALFCGECGNPFDAEMECGNECEVQTQKESDDVEILAEDSNEKYKKRRWKFSRISIILSLFIAGYWGILLLISEIHSTIGAKIYNKSVNGLVIRNSSRITEEFVFGPILPIIAGVFLVIFIISLFPNAFLKRYNMTVSKKCVSKIFKNGKRLDIPMDTISLTEATKHFNGILIYGRQICKFTRLSNRDYVYSVINQCLMERQEAAEKARAEGEMQRTAMSAEETAYRENVHQDLNYMQNVSSADEIIKYKNLLDQGIITEEEFNAKKKQLLGL